MGDQRSQPKFLSRLQERLTVHPSAGSLEVPPLVRAMALVAALVFTYAAFRMPETFSYGIDLERAERAESNGDHETSMRLFKRIVERFPQASNIRLALIRSCIAAKDGIAAQQHMRWFEGKAFPEDTLRELGKLEQQVRRLPGAER